MTLIETEVRSAERNAVASSCCGVLGETVLTDSAVIILFAGLLGAGEGFTLLTTSLLPLSNGLCILPMAWLASHAGSRRLVLLASALAGIAYFTAAAAPWFSAGASVVLLGSVFFFSLSLSGFVAGWFPLLDTFLEPERRVSFFGWMRFWHQAASVAFLVLTGVAVGAAADVRQLQWVLFLSGLIFLGRGLFAARIPVFPESRGGKPGWRSGLSVAAANQRLLRFARYVFVLNLSVYGVVPLTLLYLKHSLRAGDNVVVLVSAAALSGMFFGYAGVAQMVKRWGERCVFRAVHPAFALIALALIFIRQPGVLAYVMIAALLMVWNILIAAVSVVSTSEMLAHVSERNKTMDMAYFGAFCYGGQGVSRLITSLMVGSAVLGTRVFPAVYPVSRYRLFYLLVVCGILLAARALPSTRNDRSATAGRGDKA